MLAQCRKRMNEAASKSDAPERQRQALLVLLGDDDPKTFQSIRSQIIALGSEASDWLRPHLLSNDPVLRRNAREIITSMGRQAADTRFLGFCLQGGEELNLDDAVWMLARTRYPDSSIEAYGAILDDFARQLAERIDPLAETEETLAVLNQFMFEEQGFCGNEENYYEPENSYLNRVIDRRTGNPVSLCTILMLVARRLRLPISGIGLPGHFVARFQDPSAELFIDCFNRGKVLSKAECVKYLTETGHTLQDGYLSPVSPRRTLQRMCSNLHQIYSQLEQQEEADRVGRYLIALAR
jgi:regulator of sirC expression with transglutaminase-like and TPR domain